MKDKGDAEKGLDCGTNLGPCISASPLAIVSATHTHNTNQLLWMEQKKGRDPLSVRLMLLFLSFAMADCDVV